MAARAPNGQAAWKRQSMRETADASWDAPVQGSKPAMVYRVSRIGHDKGFGRPIANRGHGRIPRRDLSAAQAGGVEG
jgi:hypothetical protein